MNTLPLTDTRHLNMRAYQSRGRGTRIGVPGLRGARIVDRAADIVTSYDAVGAFTLRQAVWNGYRHPR
jgi:hypothetical protein